MKICPKCSVRYSEMWNICVVCKSPLRKEGVFKKVFTNPPLPNQPAFSLIESVIEKANTIFLYLDKNMKPVICNQAIEHVTGYSREEIFKEDWLGLLFRNHPSRKEMFKAFLKSCLTSTKSRAFEYECAVVKKDGSESILSWKNITLVDGSGNIPGIICTVNDIAKTKSTKGDAAVHLQQLRNIFASIKDYPLITTNLEGKITYYEEGTVRFFGWEDDMTRRDISIIFPEKDRDKIAGQIKESVREYCRFEDEVELLRHKEEIFPALITVTTLLDNKNKSIGYIYIAKDISKRKRLEEDKLQTERLAAIAQFANGVAHEMNNPLLVILGRLDMLSMGGEEVSPTVKQTMETLKNQAQRMRVIIDRLLTYSRKKTVRMDTIEVNKILKTISPLLAYQPEFKKITWKEDLAEGLPKIQGDFNQLQEVFLNIGLNACQAIPESGVVTISSVDKKDGFIEVAVEDTGVGMKKEELDKLFTPFFTARRKGVGLGLVICQHIISSHRGKITVKSEFGKGATFRVRLPVKKE